MASKYEGKCKNIGVLEEKSATEGLHINDKKLSFIFLLRPTSNI